MGLEGRRERERERESRHCAHHFLSFSSAGIELVPLSGAFEEPELVKIDKPFVFLIRDKKKKVPLFIGNVMDPRAGM